VLRICVCVQIEVTLILAMDQNAQHMNHRIKGMDLVGAWQVDPTLWNLKGAISQKNMIYRANNLPLMCRNSV
jgi:hypothetical protein